LGIDAFRLQYELSPIVLVGGIATNMVGGLLPILNLTEPGAFSGGALSPGADVDDYFAHWLPLPGTTLEDWDVGEYPFANQAIAANAMISKPLVVSMLMICPARTSDGFSGKLATMQGLKKTLDQHANLGGTYTVATPSFIYDSCLLLRVSDATRGEAKQSQIEWQFDFEQPLVTLDQAQIAYNALLTKMSNGTQIVGQPPLAGGSPTVGSPGSLAGPPTVPSSQNLPAAGGPGVPVSDPAITTGA
jgi:hypothetical protein